MTSRAGLAALIEQTSRIVVFTGAGMSTESGIPDFRSPGGVWSRMTPIPFAEFMTSETARREAWRRTFSGAAGWVGATPNSGHFAISGLTRRGKISAIITQNVDGLHQASGVAPELVIELHGNASYAVCLECGLRHELEPLAVAFKATGALPACRTCGSVVKTATISFGQPLPTEAFARAESLSREADLFLALGSSLVVHPAARLPLLAKASGAALAIVNREPTPLDRYADLVLHEEIGAVLEAVLPSV